MTDDTRKNRFVKELFDLSERVVIVTGGGGFLGRYHGEAVAEAGGYAIIADINIEKARAVANAITERTGVEAMALDLDITDLAAVEDAQTEILSRFGRIDALINNAANDPKVEPDTPTSNQFSRIENFPQDVWDDDIAVGLTGAFHCARVFGGHMAVNGGGSIVNIASDLGVISPDQRIYQQSGLDSSKQPVKPITYSVVKTGLLGMTRYLATYWAEQNVRVNAISPAGIYNGHDEEFMAQLTDLIPMGRMANVDELKGAVLYLCADASSFVTGTNLMVDGGRTCW